MISQKCLLSDGIEKDNQANKWPWYIAKDKNYFTKFKIDIFLKKKRSCLVDIYIYIEDTTCDLYGKKSSKNSCYKWMNK